MTHGNDQIAERVSIGSCCVIGPNVQIGPNCQIASSVTLSNCTLGERVTLLPGVRVGQVSLTCNLHLWLMVLNFLLIEIRMDSDIFLFQI